MGVSFYPCIYPYENMGLFAIIWYGLKQVFLLRILPQARACSFAGRIDPADLTPPLRPRERRDPVVSQAKVI